MSDSVTYEFTVIRVVPRVEREEFLNVGVMVFAKRRRYLGIKYHVDEPRLRAFAPDLDPDLIRRHLHAWEAVCQGTSGGGPIGQLDPASRFRWLAATRSTILQTSPTHPGLCEEPEATVEALFAQYVA
jgi:hypothetical protein